MAAQPDDQTQSEKQPTSIRKVEANRKNAQRSTGPRTPEGKTYSSRNAITHGLFIRFLVAEHPIGEYPWAFQRFFARLCNELQPVGPLEETEVELIAVNLLRLQRLWRYENAEVQAADAAVARNKESNLYHHLAMSPTRRTQMALLRTAEKEAEERGHISPKLMEEIFSENVELMIKWPSFRAEAEKSARQKWHGNAKMMAKEKSIPLAEAKALLAADLKSCCERDRFVAVGTVRQAIEYLSSKWGQESAREIDNEYQRQLIPNDCEVDKIIRYASMFEKQLSRAYDRLERLQRRRQGEPVPPPVSVRLTRQ